MEKVAESVKEHSVQIQEFKQQITKMVTNTNTNFSNLTEKINNLKQDTEKHELINDMATLKQNMEKTAKCVEKHTEDIKGINDNLVTGIAHVTERVRQLEMNAPSQDLLISIGMINHSIANLQRQQKDMGQQAGLPRVTSLEQNYHNLSSRLSRIQELTERIIPLEQLVEEIRDGTYNDLPMCNICGARPCYRKH